MYRRVNVTLPEATLKLMDRAADKGDRSRLIDEAVRFFLRARSRTRLRQLLKAGARRRAHRDLTAASDWFSLADK